MHLPGWIRLLAITLVAAFGAAVTVAIVIAIVDLYLTGHNRPALGRPWLEWPEFGIRMSRADVILYIVSVGTGALVWMMGRRNPI